MNRRNKISLKSYSGILTDIHVYGGLVLVAIGLWQWHPAPAIAVPGAFLVFMGYGRS